MKFIGRWLDREGVVHVDNPYKRKGLVIGYWDHDWKKEAPRTLARHPCGRSSMAIHRYLPRNTVVTCLTCLVATFEV